MPAIKQNDLLLRLVKDVNEIRSALRRTVANLPLYDISNENSPASISTNQNNYVPGNYDILRINATADVSITGFSGGVKGRFLEILNVGTGRISFPDESASSLAANRIATPYDETVTLLPNARARFYYDSTQQRWTLSDAPNIQGEFGKMAILRHATTTTIDTIEAGVYKLVEPDTVETDEWGYWNVTTGQFEIPTGENGLYSLTMNCYWDSTGTTDDWTGAVYFVKNGTIFTGVQVGTILNNFNDKTGYGYAPVLVTVNVLLNAGDYFRVYVYQDAVSHADRYLKTVGPTVPVFTFAKL